MKSPTPTVDSTANAPAATEIRVWDIPVRVFHWALVLLLGFSWYTGKNGGLDEMTWHMWSGYTVLALVLFRVLWGLAGSTTARFSTFLYGPGAAVSYATGLARRQPSRYLGHTPLGGWMVAVLLVILLVQTGSGLFANDDVFTEGPLVAWVTKETSDWITTIHKWNFELLLVLVGVHVAAVLYYAVVLRENLVKAMFTGRKPLPAGLAEPTFRFARLGTALLLLGISAGAVYALLR